MAEANAYIAQLGLSGAHNGNADAFRHAFVSAAMTQDFGSLAANLAGQANELRGDWNGQPEDERNMDLHNNEIGRGLADGTTTRSQIANAALSALNSGQLVTNPNNTSVNYDPVSDITSAQNAINDAFNNMVADVGEGGVTLSDGYTQADYFALTNAMRELSGEIDDYVEYSDDLSQSERNQLRNHADNLDNQAQQMETLYYDPLVLDMNGDGIQTTSARESDASFDLFTGHGFAASHGWVSPDDALLAIDRNSNNTIDDITELFGSAEQSGFEELSGYDENQDGVIDSNDTVFSDLLIWVDRNGDGVSQADELRALSDVDIVSIDVSASESALSQNGNVITSSSTFTFSDGTQNAISDVNFGVDIQSIRDNQSEDVFLFEGVSGVHTLNFSEDGLDVISLSDASFEDLNIIDTGLGARVEIGESFALNLQGISAEQLTQDDFQFV